MKVTQATSLTRSGISDWLVQRVTAVILAAWTLVVLTWIARHPALDYATWKQLFDATWMQLFTLLALLSTCAHAWIGIWTIGSDYLREHTLGPAAKGLRMIWQLGSALAIIAYLLWGLLILWR